VARGGRREGAGRPWGSRDRVKRRSASIAEIATRDALAFMQTNDMQIFEGDSVAFLISVSRNKQLPLRERMAAAMAVSPYERVRLTAVDMRIRDPEWNDEDAREKVIHALDRLAEVHQQEAHEAMIEKAKAGFALIKQDRIYREPDVLLSPSTPAPPPRHEPHVVDVEPTVVEREPEKVPPLSQQLRFMRFPWHGAEIF
jgi:Asp-tRNA(Asn)/Glu-tRNA(Gln) amidotransferase A subunit family amidase